MQASGFVLILFAFQNLPSIFSQIHVNNIRWEFESNRVDYSLKGVLRLVITLNLLH